jgi:hypothetical protein
MMMKLIIGYGSTPKNELWTFSQSDGVTGLDSFATGHQHGVLSNRTPLMDLSGLGILPIYLDGPGCMFFAHTHKQSQAWVNPTKKWINICKL